MLRTRYWVTSHFIFCLLPRCQLRLLNQLVLFLLFILHIRVVTFTATAPWGLSLTTCSGVVINQQSFRVKVHPLQMIITPISITLLLKCCKEIIIIIMSCRKHGYPWPSLATSPYHSLPLVGLQGYIPYPHIAAVCMFELGHMRGSILALYLLIICLDHILWTSIDVMKENSFRYLKKG